MSTPSDFTEKVYECVKKIPIGSVTTYKLVAIAIGSPGSSRAVGSALKKNKNHFLSNNKLVPCHRVVSTSLKISGFLGKTDLLSEEVKTKIALLESEGVRIDQHGKVILGKGTLYTPI